jgi:hypothetical protein
MKFSQAGVTIICIVLVYGANGGFSQTPEKTESDAVRVTVSTNTDGSRTVYKFNDAQHVAVATITDQEGKLREKIRYDKFLDPTGAFDSRASTSTIAGAIFRKKPKARKMAPFCIRSFIVTIKTGNEQAIPSSMRQANCWAA